MVKRSIFKKLYTTMVGLIIALLVTTAIVQIMFQKDAFEKELEKRTSLINGRLVDKGQALAKNLSIQVEEGISTFNLYGVADQLKSAVHDNKGLDYIILMKSTGKVYIHTINPELEMTVLSENEDLFAAAQTQLTVSRYSKNGKSYMEFIAPIMVGGEQWGVLRMGFSLDAIEEEIVNSKKEIVALIKEMVVRLILTTGIFILLGTSVVLFISERISRPLLYLTRFAYELSSGNFVVSDDVKKIHIDGEIGALTSAFFQMARNLNSSYKKLEEHSRALEEYSRTLEQKVEERTTELAGARDQAIAADKSKSEFLSMMSHEIRTPMNAIIGMTQLALQTDLNEKQQDYLNKVQTASKGLLRIINDILDFSKIEAGELDLESVPFDLSFVLDNISGLVAEKIIEKDLDFNIIIDNDVPEELLGDPLRITQILLNLTHNAVKFTDNGSIVIQVVRADKPEKENHVMLAFSVKDTGIGLSSEQISGLFRFFSQAEKSTTRKYGGTGLGLAICNRMVKMMGGVINVDSAPGSGSVFSFTAEFGVSLNVNQISSDGQLFLRYKNEFCVLDERREVIEKKCANSPKGTELLLVEDNDINQQVAKEVLENKGFNVTIAVNGIDAVQKVRTAYFDVVLMDLQMPVMDGYEATKIIRSESQFEDLPIIALTAHAMSDIKQRCLNAGMNDYVTKPIDVDKLLTILMGFIDPDLLKQKEALMEGKPVQNATSQFPLLPGIDTDKGLNNVVGKADLFSSLLFQFSNNFSSAESQLDCMLASGDSDAALRLLHTMKGVAAILAMDDLNSSIDVLSHAISRDWRYKPELWSDFVNEQNKVLQSVLLLQEMVA